MAVNWALGAPRDIAADYQQGYQTAQRNALLQEEQAQRREERKRSEGLRNALTGAINPQTGDIDYGAARQAYIGAGDVQGAIGIGNAQRQQMEQQRELHRDNIIRGARLVRQMNPTDDAGWQRVRAMAQQAGIDVSQVPPNFDPNYVQQLLAAAQALADPSQGYTLGEGDVRYDVNGNVVGRGGTPRPRYYSVPPGGQLVPEPGAGGQPSAPVPPPPVGTVEGGYRFRGGNPADPSSWEPVGGAPTSNEAPAFRPAPGGAASAPRTFP